MRSQFFIFIISGLIGVTAGQQAWGTPEVHPKVPMKQCKNSATPGEAPVCTTISTSIVLELGYRNLTLEDGTSCYNQSSKPALNTTICADPVKCALECGYHPITDGYENYGVHSNEADGSVSIKLFGPLTNKGPGARVYFLSEDERKYQFFKLKNREFSFETNMAQLPCGANGALYFLGMPEDGGMAEAEKAGGSNKAGAGFGMEYCDATCPPSTFVDGKANLDVSSGAPLTGTCCNEMDVWEANSRGTMETTHLCPMSSARQQCALSSSQCQELCDRYGCGSNAWRMGNHTFYGAGSDFIVDTNKPFRVVTQWITDDNTDTGTLVDIRRMYVQNGKMIMNADANLPGIDNGLNSINDEFCEQQHAAFNNSIGWNQLGGAAAFSKQLDEGMVLCYSMWARSSDSMTWLDSTSRQDMPGGNPKDPTTIDKSEPGVLRGPCDVKEGSIDNIEKNYPDTQLKFWDLRFGEIGSTV